MSLNTNGWDYTYNMSFKAINDSLKKMFEKEIASSTTLKNALATALGDGYTGKIIGRIHHSGEKYEAPLPSIKDITYQDSITPSTFQSHFGVNSAERLTPGAGYTSAPSITIDPPPAGDTVATASVLLGLTGVTVVNQSTGYGVPPIVTISPPASGTTATAVAEISTLGEVTSIILTDIGSGYTTPPTITIAGPGGYNPAATATALMGPLITITNPGSGYNSQPAITLTGGGATTQATFKAHMETYIQDSPTGAGYSFPPTLEIDHSGKAGANGALAFASMEFSNKNKIVTSAILSGTNKAKEAIKACLKAGVKEIGKIKEYETLDTSWIDTFIDDASNDPTDTTVLEYCLSWIDKLSDKIHEKSNHRESLDLQFLKKQVSKTTLTTSFKNSINNNYYDPLLTDVEVELKNNETRKIINRCLAGLQTVDNSIIYNLDEDPSIAADFNKNLIDLDAEIADNLEGFLESMIEMLLSFVPVRSIHTMTTIVRDANALSKEYPLKKIKLNFSKTWNVEVGGDKEILKINIPIETGLLNFGRNSKAIKSTDNFSVPLTINLNWMRAAFKSDAITVAENDRSITINDTALTEKINNLLSTGTATPAQIRDAVILKASIENYFNHLQTPSKDADMKFTPIVNQYYCYHDVFTDFNIAAHDAINKPELAWLYPTRLSFSTQDGASIPAKLKNSVFSICGMIEGHKNNDDGYTDINAIPEDASSALIIERSIFGQNMVASKIGEGVFTENMSFKKLGEYSMVNENEGILKNIDFRSSWTHGFIPYFDLIQYIKKLKENVEKNGKVAESSALIKINQDHINFRIKDVEYYYSVENKPKFTQEYLTVFSYESDTLKALTTLVDVKSDYFHTDFIQEGIFLLIQSVIKTIGDKEKKMEKVSPSSIVNYLPLTKEKWVCIKQEQLSVFEQIKKHAALNAKEKEDIETALQNSFYNIEKEVDNSQLPLNRTSMRSTSTRLSQKTLDKIHDYRKRNPSRRANTSFFRKIWGKTPFRKKVKKNQISPGKEQSNIAQTRNSKLYFEVEENK